jgi:hypothetical protein
MLIIIVQIFRFIKESCSGIVCSLSFLREEEYKRCPPVKLRMIKQPIRQQTIHPVVVDCKEFCVYKDLRHTDQDLRKSITGSNFLCCPLLEVRIILQVWQLTLKVVD